MHFREYGYAFSGLTPGKYPSPKLHSGTQALRSKDANLSELE